MKQQFLWYWHQARMESDLWEKGNKLCKPYDCLLYCSKPQSMEEETRQNPATVNWSDGPGQPRQHSRKELWTKDSCTERELQWSSEWLPLEFSAEYWSVHVSEKAIFLRPGKNNLGQWILQHKGKRQIPWKTPTIKLHYRRNRCLSL